MTAAGPRASGQRQREGLSRATVLNPSTPGERTDASPRKAKVASASGPSCSITCWRVRRPPRLRRSDQLLANCGIVQKVIPRPVSRFCSTARKRATCESATPWPPRGVVRNVSISWEKGLPARPAQSREPLLVGDVRRDPRYLNTVDATRTEMAVPMTARARLVGVIDVQSTRLTHTPSTTAGCFG